MPPFSPHPITMPHILTRVLFLAALLLAMPAAAPAQFPPTSSLQERLEQLYCEEPHQLNTQPLYAIGPLLDLYRKNQFQPLWSKAMARDLAEAVARAAEDGLIPADYHQAGIQAALLEPDTPLGPEQALDNDILFSDALILLGEHILHGKVDGRDVEEKEGLAMGTVAEIDVDYYLQLLRSGRIAEAMRARAPQHPGYLALRQNLARYRQMAARGDWPPVPAGPSLKPGMSGERVAALKARLAASGELAASAATGDRYDEELSAAVQRFQLRYGLEADGMTGRQTLAALNTPIAERIEQIRVNLERTRWILHDMPASAVLVDIAGFRLHYRHNGKLLWSSRVMVGQPLNQTPVFRSAITYLVLNPTWTIPPDMLKNETIPKILQDSSYLRRERLKIYDFNGAPVPAGRIDWSRYRSKGFPYVIRQDAGPDNALGRIKFMFPNPYHVYLHDTPSKGLFDRNSRALSHGCIRVQSPLDLGRMILANDTGNPTTVQRFDTILDNGTTTGIALKTPLPLFLLYTTAQDDGNGGITFSPDVYGRDAAVIRALNQPPRPLLQKALGAIAAPETEDTIPAAADTPAAEPPHP